MTIYSAVTDKSIDYNNPINCFFLKKAILLMLFKRNSFIKVNYKRGIRLLEFQINDLNTNIMVENPLDPKMLLTSEGIESVNI